MAISDNGIELIISFEKLALKSYKCPAGIWTLGIGSTIFNGKSVVEGQTCTKEEAYNNFRIHLGKEIYPYFDKITVPLNQNQFDALSSLVYNIGCGNFCSSTLLKKLNKKDYQGAADQFLVWNKVNKLPCDGLTRRRTAERLLFLTPVEQ